MDVLHSSRYWSPPIGIPIPEFGIFETHTIYSNLNYAYSTGSAAYKDAGNGPYTHYIDSLSPSATNTNNNYGTVATPRINMPSAAFVAPGAVIEVHNCSSTPSQISMVYIGSKSLPVFVRGANTNTKGLFTNVSFLIRGQYVIYENLEFITQGPSIRSITEFAHHISLRYSYIHSAANVGVIGDTINFLTSQVIIYSNQIYTDNFDPNGGEFPENDIAGVGINKNTEDVWVIDNDIRGQSGDAIGAGHAANYTAKKWYIGRNLLHGTGENGIDLKEVDGVVVSQNKLYHFTGLSSGNGGGGGTAVVVHYGPNVSAKNVWFLYNEIYDANGAGIQVGGSQLFDTFFIGNIIHDIHNVSLDAKGFYTFQSCKINLLGNVFYNNDNGINASGSAACGKLILKNNIISTIQNPSGYYINTLTDSGYKSAAEITNNIFYPSGPLTDGTLTNCITQDPLFVDTPNNNFKLQSNSPAINAADSTIMEDLATQFFNMFGVDIHKDFAGLVRPINSWDIGPYEFR